jgi:hypothetical protein
MYKNKLWKLLTTYTRTKMKIAIMLIGTVSNKHRNRNWKFGKDNIKKNLFDCWGSQHEITSYIVSDEIHPEEMIEFYNVKKFTYDIRLISGKYEKALDVISEEDVDFVIMTRPDILFFKPVTDLNIDFQKFNFLFKEKTMFKETLQGGKILQLTCDNFFALPKKYVNPFRQALIDRTNCAQEEYGYSITSGELHTIYSFLHPYIGKENIHFISHPQTSFSGGNNIYVLHRYDIVPGDLGPIDIV